MGSLSMPGLFWVPRRRSRQTRVIQEIIAGRYYLRPLNVSLETIVFGEMYQWRKPGLNASGS
jgi:hypothetical protein